MGVGHVRAIIVMFIMIHLRFLKLFVSGSCAVPLLFVFRDFILLSQLISDKRQKANGSAQPWWLQVTAYGGHIQEYHTVGCSHILEFFMNIDCHVGHL